MQDSADNQPMSSTLPSPAKLQTAPSPFAVFSPRQFLRHGFHVAVVSVLVAWVLSVVRTEPFLTTLMYAESIALCSWACIDVGRFLWRTDPQTGWPSGWAAVALPMVGCTVGFFAGAAIANALLGQSSVAAYRGGARSFSKDVLVSVVIGALFSGYFYLRGRTAYHQAQVAASERDATLARLGLLQSQLEPHMLFNTLANLRVLISTDPARAQAMLDRLIAFLRATLAASRAPWHPLQAEFERLTDYLALMAVRMGPRLAVDLDLPAELRELLVPPLLLQPLVENSIKHGLEPKVAGGRIDVRARRDGATLVLTVRDTGLGLAEHADPGAPAASGASSFGLTQVRERLATLYGDAASFQFEPVGDALGGTLARITLPAQTSPEGSAASARSDTAAGLRP
jgi:hypothetical protein